LFLLKKVLVERTIAVRGQTIRKGLLAEEAAATRDALCRTLYGNLFDWIVKKLNECLRPTTKIADVTLGVLDIFGFENFALNSLEQLCINYANEKLHAVKKKKLSISEKFLCFLSSFFLQAFHRASVHSGAARVRHRRIKMDKGWHKKFFFFLFRLTREKIASSDNADAINLIEGKMGILTLLDEESKLQSGTDVSFLKKMNSTLTSSSKCYKQARLDPTCFVVSHFAEEVSYQSEGFREKNQNVLADDVVAVICKSENELVKALMVAPAAVEVKGSATTRGLNTIGSTFRRQLIALKKELDQTKPFFIRCIKPNAQQKAEKFEDAMVASQLAYSGMVETVKVKQIWN
jgi:myosin heavy subunit